MAGHSRNIEECPLNSHSQCKKTPRNFKGPLRVIRLCLLGVILPACFVGIPIFMRYRVYSYQLYPLAMSDMRLLDNKVSTTWCQRQLVKVNTTFNAFLLPDAPSLSPEFQHLSMVRHLSLEDDFKEYWGFYLLAGSSVTVSTCVRWPGASLIVIKGHKHLHECAYIGDNSSEELEELMEAVREGTAVKPTQEPDTDTKPTQKSNEPDLMKRHREDVEFHSPAHVTNSKHKLNSSSISDLIELTDPKTMKQILEAIQEKSGRKNRKSKSEDLPKDHIHVRRNSTIAKGEGVNLDFDVTNQKTDSQEALKEILEKLNKLGEKGSKVLQNINTQYKLNTNNHVIDLKGRHYSKPPVKYNDNVDRARRRKRELILQTATQLNDHDQDNDNAMEEGFNPDGIADHRGTFNETTLNDMSNSEFWSSFSSSEEALLNCAGLILNLPLTPHHNCHPGLTHKEAEETYLANSVTYKVPSNGYYFFVFNSENEVQTNYLRVQFHLKKAMYNVSNPVQFCKNSSDVCALNLKFFSNEKLVMELPVQDNETLWNEEFVVVSECEPRTAIYIISIVAVPIFVILFAFS